jgi:DNA-binding NtrC family response regulator
MQSNILVVDDDPSLCDLIARDLDSRGHQTRHVQSAEDGLRLLEAHNFDVVVTDVSLGGMSGVELCSQVHARHEDMPVVVMSGYGTVESAVAAIRAGAYDFIIKPFERDQFSLVIDRALGIHALRREVVRLRSATYEVAAVAPELLGRSPALEQIRNLITRVADTESTVLITGESGTGKELVAKAIHDCSTRRSGEFVAINCAAMPENLLESELFGHTRGAFTDAKATRAGLFVRANRGTIFLDEIGEMPAGMQAKLLRAVQDRHVRAVGSDEEVAFDARIIAATHSDLEADVRDGKFREDLFYRINVVRMHIPPLRMRGNDALILAQRFLDRLAPRSKHEVKGMTAGVAQKLVAYPWPGNVRQLQNCMERAVAVARDTRLALEDLPDEVRDYTPSSVDVVGREQTTTSMPTMDEIERRYILQVLGAVGGNKTVAAQLLGFDRRTLYRKLERMHLAIQPATDVDESGTPCPT